MRFASLCLLTAGMPVAPASPDFNAPLPDAAQLRELALTSMRRSIAALERYSCSVESRSDQLDGKGRVQKSESKVAERVEAEDGTHGAARRQNSSRSPE